MTLPSSHMLKFQPRVRIDESRHIHVVRHRIDRKNLTCWPERRKEISNVTHNLFDNHSLTHWFTLTSINDMIKQCIIL